ncbi:ROK family protein [Gelidibacter salicanalis]|uniref:ROK family protein n=1 Tax=Gelidibacter salicanalis TaxID=291193 RepID=A0A934NJX0_9FLAO|nr:ROK family protein [Gelidibacter salicanalis]MBJ7882119.1 ROK family protein [Gelidibacter salicanalis]
MNIEVLGVDIGGTTINVGLVENNSIKNESQIAVDREAAAELTIQSLKNIIRDNLTDKVTAIGVGVPAVVDPIKGIVYDVQNIPAWKKIPLKEILEREFRLPVFINNDANCFALGEATYGEAKNYSNVIGLSLGTGIGMGIIINNALYNGVLCGAGEIGMLPYKESIIEDYASSFFFSQHYNSTAKNMALNAEKSDSTALKAFNEYGNHLGEAIKSILYLLAPDAIILGGSISKAYPYFKDSMFESLKSFAYQKQIENLVIQVSSTKGSAILGAAALCIHNKNIL